MTLTKNKISEKIAADIGISRKKSLKLVEQLIEIMKRNLEDGEDILIIRFGKFYIKNKNERLGRNPATGSRLMIRGRNTVSFKYSKTLKKFLNRNG